MFYIEHRPIYNWESVGGRLCVSTMNAVVEIYFNKLTTNRKVNHFRQLNMMIFITMMQQTVLCLKLSMSSSNSSIIIIFQSRASFVHSERFHDFKYDYHPIPDG